MRAHASTYTDVYWQFATHSPAAMVWKEVADKIIKIDPSHSQLLIRHVTSDDSFLCVQFATHSQGTIFVTERAKKNLQDDPFYTLLIADIIKVKGR